MVENTNGWPSIETKRPSTDSRNIGFFLDGHPYQCLDDLPASLWAIVDQEYIEPKDFMEFVVGCIADAADAERFRQAISDRENILAIETMRQLFVALIERYGDRPTIGSTDSSGGPENTGPSSTGISPLTGSISGS